MNDAASASTAIDTAATAETEAKTTARRAGRGLVSITAAKLYFIVAGFAVQFLLPRLFGSPVAFGLYSKAMNPVSILNNVLITATVQTVSKHVSEDVESAPRTLRQGLALQLVLGGALALGLWGFASWFALKLGDTRLEPLLRTGSVVVLSYALYAALIGTLNGQQRFGHQAGLDMSYTTLRTVGILGAAGLGFGAQGAMGGFAAAAVGVLLIALVFVGIGRRGGSVPWGRWVRFMAPLWIYQLALNMILQIDLSVLGSNAAAIRQAAGMSAHDAAEEASRLAAFYRAAQTFAFVPYQLILSVTFVVFPMVSSALSSGRTEDTRGYVRASMRFSLIVLLALAAPFSGAAKGVMRLAYPAEYVAGAPALSVLAFGVVAFALFVIGATILSGAGQPTLPAIIAVATVGLVLAGDTALIHMAQLSAHDGLVGVATGTTLGMTAALAAVAFALHLRFGAFLSPLCALRVSIAAAAAWWVAHVVPSQTALQGLLAVAAGGIVYLVALVAIRELGPRDLAMVTAIVRRQPRPKS